jgi:hypothetical protein
MTPMMIATVAFACIFGGALLTMLLAKALPDHHLRPESKDAVKLGLGFLATLAALVLGLLIAAAKGTYDTQNGSVKQLAADVLLLDRVLARYGPETKPLQKLLRRGGDLMVNRLWPEDDSGPADLTPGEAREVAESFYEKVAALEPQDDTKRSLRARALDIANRLEQTRLRLFAQRGSAIPGPFLVVLVFWVVILFAGFALLAPSNLTVVVMLLVCALSVSGALFLILELDRPFDGIMRVPSTPLRAALSQLGK